MENKSIYEDDSIIMEFYIITDCTERGLYRKHKKVKQICQKNLEAKYFRFHSPEDIPAAQDFCAAHGISVTRQDWEDLHTAGRLSMYAQQGTLPPGPALVTADTQQCGARKKDNLPPDAAAVIYTDGSFYSVAHHKKKGRKRALGGWAAVILLRVYHDAMVTVSGHTAKHRQTDPYYMELLAVVKALKRLKTYDIDGRVVLYTDCQNLVTDYNQKLRGWADCGYKKPDGADIPYRHLWEKIQDHARDIKGLQICWIKGHAKNIYNNQCHLTAQAEALLRKSRRKTAQDTADPIPVLQKGTTDDEEHT